MKEYIGQMVEVAVYTVDEEWEERELLAVMPDDIEYKYICRAKTTHSDYVSAFKYARPLKKEVYYYQYEKLYASGYISETVSITEEHAKDKGYTEENGWYKIESSKRTWGH